MKKKEIIERVDEVRKECAEQLAENNKMTSKAEAILKEHGFYKGSWPADVQQEYDKLVQGIYDGYAKFNGLIDEEKELLKNGTTDN